MSSNVQSVPAEPTAQTNGDSGGGLGGGGGGGGGGDGEGGLGGGGLLRVRGWCHCGRALLPHHAGLLHERLATLTV